MNGFITIGSVVVLLFLDWHTIVLVYWVCHSNSHQPAVISKTSCMHRDQPRQAFILPVLVRLSSFHAREMVHSCCTELTASASLQHDDTILALILRGKRRGGRVAEGDGLLNRYTG
jgi:hypothetical protein